MAEVSFFVAGAVFGEIWNDSRSAVVLKSNLGCEAGCGSRFHSRIQLGMVSDRSRIVIDVSSVLEKCF